MTVANWVGEDISVGGTGNLTLSGAIDGHCRFQDQYATNTLFKYVAVDGNDLETGWGYLSTTTTLVRDKILQTLSSGTLDKTSPTALTLSTATQVFVAEDSGSLQSFPIGSNEYVSSLHHCEVSLRTVALAADRLYYIPFWLPIAQEIDGMALVVSTAAGTGTDYIKAGIYSVDKNGDPGTKIAELTADLDPSTTGFKEGSLSSSIFLPGGWYFLAVLSNVAVTVRAFDPNYDLMTMNGHNNNSFAYRIVYQYKNTQTSLPTTGNPDQINVNVASAALMLRTT